MRILRRGSASAVLALCLGTLAACGDGSSRGNDQGQAVRPPTSGSSPVTGSTRADGGDDGKGGAALRGKVIVLDPGHNGANGAHPSQINKRVDIGNGRKECDTTGTETAAGYTESAFNWDVSNRLAKLLRARGAKVILTRENDRGVGPCIDERAGIGNRAKADAVLSVHADGGPLNGHGFHVIGPEGIGGQDEEMVSSSVRLGRALRDSYRDGTGLAYSTYQGKDAIVRRSDLGGLNLSTVPKVFIECGNMNNPPEAAKLSSAPFRQRIAESLSKGFEAYFDKN